MRAAVFYEPGDLRIEDIPRGTPGPGEISVSVRAATTCGTDLKAYRRGHPKIIPVLPARLAPPAPQGRRARPAPRARPAQRASPVRRA